MAVYLVLAALTIAIAHLVDSRVVKKENSFFDTEGKGVLTDINNQC